MNPVRKALWYVESHFHEEVTLDDVAEAAGVSRHHLTRAFGAATGLPVVRYIRARRLTEAARSLASRPGDILGVALDAGYGSHEAFTRAFRDHFGVTPESVRDRGGVAHLKLTEPLAMDATLLAHLAAPRLAAFPARLITGLSRRYQCDDKAAIPAQWQEFAPHIDTMPGRVDGSAWGVVFNTDEDGGMDYLTGVEVGGAGDVASGYASVRVPAGRYAVFSQAEHISSITRTWATIWSEWLPNSGHAAGDGPVLEHYPPSFDAATGLGGFELWVPLAD